MAMGVSPGLLSASLVALSLPFSDVVARLPPVLKVAEHMFCVAMCIFCVAM